MRELDGGAALSDPQDEKPSKWPAWALLLAGLAITSGVLTNYKMRMDREAKHAFDMTCGEIGTKILTRLDAHQQLLRSGAAFLESSETISREDWRRFVGRQKIESLFPGIQGIGFALFILPRNLKRHVDDIRAEGFPAYKPWPEGDREAFSSIVFLEPFADRNLRAFGYDMFSDAVRRESMERARDQDAPALSGKVVLVQETDEDPQTGTLMYVPVYRRGMPVETTDQRRLALRGWAYSPYRMDDLMRGILGSRDEERDRRIRLQIFDGGTASAGSLLYDSYAASGNKEPSAISRSLDNPVQFYGRKWLLRYRENGTQIATGIHIGAWNTAFAGLCVSLLLFWLSTSRLDMRFNARRMAEKVNRDLRETTDRLRLATRAGGIGIWDYDLGSGKLSWEEEMFRLYGAPPVSGPLSFQTWMERIHPDDRLRCEAEIRSTLLGEQEFDSEFRIIRPDMAPRTIHAFGIVQRDVGGRARRLIGTNSDVTERAVITESLRKAKRQYENLARNIPAGIYIIHNDPQGAFAFEYASPRMTEILGISAESILSDPWAAFKPIHPEEIGEFIRLNRENVELKRPFAWEGRILKGGETRWIRISSSPEPLENGDFLWNGVVMDITEQKRIQEALESSEEKFRNIAEKLDDVIFVTGMDGSIDYISPSALRVFGWLPEQMTGRVFTDFLQESDAPKALQAFQAFFITKESGRTLDLMMKRKDGSPFVGELIASILDKGQGTVGTLGLIRDITDRKRLERVLRDRDEDLRTAQRLADIGSWKWVESNNSMTWSNQLRSILRYDPAKPVPAFEELSSFFTQESWSRLNDEIMKVLSAKGSFEMDLEVVRADGTIRNAVARGEADFDDGGKALGMHGTLQDISERKRAENRIKALLEEKELILKEVHHRIKNNMNTMISILALQTHTLTDLAAIEALNDAGGRIQSMSVLYDKLYRSSDYGSMSIKDYFENLVDEIVSLFPIGKALVVEKRFEDLVLPVKQLQTLSIVLNELLTNVMKYAFANRESGIVTVAVSSDGDRVSMVIQDNGEGMPDSVDFEHSPGFGIMLVSALTKQLEGNIRIERKSGTKIILDFPA